MKAYRARDDSAAVRVIVALALLAATLGIYWQVHSFDFVDYDDGMYVTDNRFVRAGLTLQGVRWALTNFHVNWHPLTWLSHMLDCQIFGLNAGAHHLINVLLHGANTVLLFLVLHRMTGALWQSAFVAALFGLHPLRVESVAWVAERKDVLSGFFWIVTMWAYAWYAERPDVKRYLVVALALALGLLSKPMLVTVPFVLLLLDYWPLQRTGKTPAHQLLAEKLPLLLLVVAVCVITVLAQKQMGALVALQRVPLQDRIGNALVAYCAYLGKMLLPINLAAFYPHPFDRLPWWQVTAAAVFLAGVSVAALRAAHRLPYIAVGWLWYLGTLVPVIGFVQVGLQATADRYTYIPLVGVFIILAWGVPDLVGRWRRRPLALAATAAIVLLALMGCTWRQIGYWRNTTALFEHALAVTAGNFIAHHNLGYVRERQAQLDQAIEHYEAALRARPEHAASHRNLAAVLDRKGRAPEALDHLFTALRIDPSDPKAHNTLGVVLSGRGRLTEAAHHISIALRLDPDNAKAHNNLADILIRQGRFDEAMDHLTVALQLQPDYANAHNNAGVALSKQGRLADAIAHFTAALRLEPNHRLAQRNLAQAREKQSRSEINGP